MNDQRGARGCGAGGAAELNALPVYDPVFVSRSEKFVDCSGSRRSPSVARRTDSARQDVEARRWATSFLRNRSKATIIAPG
jgi:hypothetical protein